MFDKLLTCGWTVSILMSTKQSHVNSESQCRRSHLIDADDIAGVIALLRGENDRLRQIAELLSAETEYLRQSLLPNWCPRHSLEGPFLRRPVRRSDAPRILDLMLEGGWVG